MPKVTARKLSVKELDEKIEHLEEREADEKVRFNILQGKLHLLRKRRARAAEEEARQKTEGATAPAASSPAQKKK